MTPDLTPRQADLVTAIHALRPGVSHRAVAVALGLAASTGSFRDRLERLKSLGVVHWDVYRHGTLRLVPPYLVTLDGRVEPVADLSVRLAAWAGRRADELWRPYRAQLEATKREADALAVAPVVEPRP